MSFARGKYAWGLCDTCGQRYELAELKPNIVMGRVTGALACPECNDPDHPQNFIGQVSHDDPQALLNARPDLGLDQSRAIPPGPVFPPPTHAEYYTVPNYMQDDYVETQYVP